MSKTEALLPETPAIRMRGIFTEKGIKISSKQHAEELSQRGYGTAEDTELLLTFHEALYLLGKGILEVADKKGHETDFRNLLKRYCKMNENAWAEYLAYRDLRSRGYVVREGFGSGVGFRVYERGEYTKDTAKYLILSIQEGKPISMADLTNALKQSQSLKKELVLAVMNRRGEAVYYSVSQLALP